METAAIRLAGLTKRFGAKVAVSDVSLTVPAGSIYGLIALCDRQFYDLAWLPAWFTERWVALSWSILFTLAPMLLVTAILGREDKVLDEQWTERGWLQRSREELPPFSEEEAGSTLKANLLAVGLLLFCGWVTFVLLW